MTAQGVYIFIEIQRRREIGPDIIEEVVAKERALRRAAGLFVRTALVYDGNLAKSVPAEHYFDFIVPAGLLLHPSTMNLDHDPPTSASASAATPRRVEAPTQ